MKKVKYCKISAIIYLKYVKQNTISTLCFTTHVRQNANNAMYHLNQITHKTINVSD